MSSMHILPPCDHGLGGIDNTALHRIIITPRIIVQTRFRAFAVASSGESVDICDALEIVLFLFVSNPVSFSPILIRTFYYFFDPIHNPS